MKNTSQVFSFIISTVSVNDSTYLDKCTFRDQIIKFLKLALVYFRISYGNACANQRFSSHAG